MKKYSRKTVIFVIVSYLIISCVPDKEVTSTMNRYLVNNTNKILIQELQTSIGTYELKSNGTDTTKVILSRTGVIEGGLAIGHSTISVSPVYVTKEVTYCISDTTKYEYELTYSIDGYDIPQNKSDSIYFASIVFKVLSNDTYHPKSDVVFQFTDTLKSIMTKDSSMLSKFKDYYK